LPPDGPPYGAIAYFIILLGAAIVALWLDGEKTSHFHTVDYSDWKVQQYVLVCLFGLACDVIVVGYHAQTSVHPKFRITILRRLCMGTHVVSGLTEILFQVLAFFAKVEHAAVLSNLAVGIATLGHIPSAAMQCVIVNGVKRITIPFYVVFLYTHAYTSWALWADPLAATALFKQCIALHGYAYVRGSIHVLTLFDIMFPHEYSVSIILTAMFSTPVIFGPPGNFLYLFSFVIFNGVVFPLMDFLDIGAKRIYCQDWYAFQPEAAEIWNHEFTRDTLGVTSAGIDAGEAKMIDHLDLSESAVYPDDPVQTTSSMLDRFRATMSGAAAGLDAAQQVVPIFQVVDPAILRKVRALPPEKKAEIAFVMITPGGHTISKRRWGALFMAWCMTVYDVNQTLHKFKDDQITLEDFTEHFPMIYEYMVDMLYSHKRIIRDIGKEEEEDLNFVRTTLSLVRASQACNRSGSIAMDERNTGFSLPMITRGFVSSRQSSREMVASYSTVPIRAGH